MSRVVVNEIQAKVGNDISFNDAAKIDTLKGKTTAGSISVQGEGTATTNLQQGLAKSWINYAQNGDTIRDSLNISSVSDNSTSEFTVVMTNVMANINYSTHGSMAPNFGVATGYGMSMYQDGSAESVPTTASYFIRTVGSNGSGYDSKYNMISVHGDLA